MKTFIFLVLQISFLNIVLADDYILELQIEGVSYDSLAIAGGNYKDKAVKIKGISDDGKNWSFTIPDSIFNSVAFFDVYQGRIDTVTKRAYNIIFQSYNGQDTLKYSHLIPDPNVKKIHAKYIGTNVRENILMTRIDNHNDENTFWGTQFIDKLSIPYYENTEYSIEAAYPAFGRFHSTQKDKPTYDEYINQYVDIVKKHPDSRFLIARIVYHLQYYDRKDDLQRIYDVFSETNKQTVFGKIIQDYITNHYTFDNMLLPVWDTGNLEPIIQDSTKINLVVFSASWCIPCHKQIPILKDIYNDLKKCVNITYISEDKPEYVDNWRKLMKDENIPWRSLLSVNDVETVRRKYNALAIPYILMVYPDQHLESIDVRLKADRDKLYSICKEALPFTY